MRTDQSERRAAFTLVEVVVTLAITAVVVGLTLSGVHRARLAAARAGCASNLRQLSLAAHSYAAAHHALPPGCAYPLVTPELPVFSQTGVSWHTSILPHLEQAALWEAARRANAADPRGVDEIHHAPKSTVVKVFLCPTEVRTVADNGAGGVWGLTSYTGVAGTRLRRNDGIFHPNFTVRFADITDGTSNTVMIGERPPSPAGWGGWYAGWGCTTCVIAQLLAVRPPGTLGGAGCPVSSSLAAGSSLDECAYQHFWSMHPGGAHFAFADGSVRFLRYEADAVLPALATRAGGELVNIPE